MNTFIEKYFGKNVSNKEIIYNSALFLSGLFCGFYSFLGILLKMDKMLVFLFFSLSFVSFVFFFLGQKYKKLDICSLIFLTFANIIVCPIVMLVSTRITVEVPLFWLIGITNAIVLLKGKVRIIHFSAQLIVDICVSYYVYVIRTKGTIMRGATTSLDYIRVAFAIIASGILCGIVIYYKFKDLENEYSIKASADKKAEEVNYAKDMFLVNVSHEIRTPLNAIIGSTDMLLNSEASIKVKEMAYNISDSSHALLSITNDLLDLSRANTESPVISNKYYDLSLMLKELINVTSIRLLDSEVQLLVRINPETPKVVMGDSVKIRQILTNIISNSIKYTKEGKIILYVDYKFLSEKAINLIFKVEDTGCGISEEKLSTLLNGDDLSTGFGLKICKQLADAMKGKITAVSKENVGSTFTFSLVQEIEVPYTKGALGKVEDKELSVCVYNSGTETMGNFCSDIEALDINVFKVYNDENLLLSLKENYDYYFIDSTVYEKLKTDFTESGVEWKKIIVIGDFTYSVADEPFEAVLTKPVSCLNICDLLNHVKSAFAKERFRGRDFSIKGATILVVDDNLTNLDVAAGILEQFKPKVLKAASGKEALLILQQTYVDLVLLDYMMPEMDGIDTLKAIRDLPDKRFKMLPVVALTANVVSGAKEMFLSEGFNRYLSKPIEADKLEKTLVELLPTDLIEYIY